MLVLDYFYWTCTEPPYLYFWPKIWCHRHIQWSQFTFSPNVSVWSRTTQGSWLCQTLKYRCQTDWTTVTFTLASCWGAPSQIYWVLSAFSLSQSEEVHEHYMDTAIKRVNFTDINLCCTSGVVQTWVITTWKSSLSVAWTTICRQVWQGTVISQKLFVSFTDENF